MAKNAATEDAAGEGAVGGDSAGKDAVTDGAAGSSAPSRDARASDGANSSVEDDVRRLARTAPDFPEPGVVFTDLTPVFADGRALRRIIRSIAGNAPAGVDLVAGIDARGFLLAGGVAVELGVGVLAVRKQGKLPPPVHGEDYALEYGTARLEVPADAVPLAGRSVLVVDDVLATGGTLRAAVDLVAKCGGRAVGVTVVSEIQGLGGRDRLRDVRLHCLTS